MRWGVRGSILLLFYLVWLYFMCFYIYAGDFILLS